MLGQLVATGGTGTLVLGAAESGYNALGAGDNGRTFDIIIVDGSATERCRDAVYTHSGTTLTRGTRLGSTTGSALNVSVGAKVYCVATGFAAQSWEHAGIAVQPGGYITTESGVAGSESDRTAQATIYYTPDVHAFVPLYDGTRWQCIAFAEATLPLSGLTTAKNYDVFGYLSAGALALELSAAWTSSTARADALARQDGRLVKSGEPTRLWLGTIRATGAAATEDSEAKRFVWNAFNQRERYLHKSISATSTYNGALRQYNADASAQVEFVTGAGQVVSYGLTGSSGVGSGDAARWSATLDSTSVASTQDPLMDIPPTTTGITARVNPSVSRSVGLGYHFIALTHGTSAGSGSPSFINPRVMGSLKG